MIEHPVIHEAFDPTALDAWQSLALHATSMTKQTLRDVVNADPDRFSRFSASAATLLLDYSKQLADTETVELLVRLARQSRVPEAVAAMFAGAPMNVTEGRAAHHVRLRAADPDDPVVAPVLARIRAYAGEIRGGAWRGYSGHAISDIVHIGIGGSSLGPELVHEALRPAAERGPRCHFVSNVDADALDAALRKLSPEHTVFHIVSKSFTTTETLLNARRARAWYLERGGDPAALGRHFLAVTSAVPTAAEFGIPESSVFPMWDWVGGRFSLWSAAGALSLAPALGMQTFDALLAGAREMDRHFESAEPGASLPVLMALLGIWNGNFLGAQSHVVIPYAERLRKLHEYLQQLEMESNGKSVRIDGARSNVHTCPVVWGGAGTNGQHAFHQLLMQGTRSHAIDFILPLNDAEDAPDRWMLANCIGQAEALLKGRSLEQCERELGAGLEPQDRALLAAHRVIEGNRPTSVVVLPDLSAGSLGALLALYEHKVFVEGIVWRINSFDQWGVELGKQLGVELQRELDPHGAGAVAGHDPATAGLLRYIRARARS